MAEKKGKFSALADLHRQIIDEEPMTSDPTPIRPAAKPAATEGQGRGRPSTGKRSNPDYKLYSHLMRRDTQRAAVARLHAEDKGRDLSDLLQDLLEKWLKT